MHIDELRFDILPTPTSIDVIMVSESYLPSFYSSRKGIWPSEDFKKSVNEVERNGYRSLYNQIRNKVQREIYKAKPNLSHNWMWKRSYVISRNVSFKIIFNQIFESSIAVKLPG
ncbi:hypothetical protein ACFFRR_000172 [Megaselia abdita]